MPHLGSCQLDGVGRGEQERGNTGAQATGQAGTEAHTPQLKQFKESIMQAVLKPNSESLQNAATLSSRHKISPQA